MLRTRASRFLHARLCALVQEEDLLRWTDIRCGFGEVRDEPDRIFRPPAVWHSPFVVGIEPVRPVHIETVDGAPGTEIQRDGSLPLVSSRHAMRRGIPSVEGSDDR